VSLASFMGGRATGPRLNKASPQSPEHAVSMGPAPTFLSQRPDLLNGVRQGAVPLPGLTKAQQRVFGGRTLDHAPSPSPATATVTILPENRSFGGDKYTPPRSPPPKSAISSSPFVKSDVLSSPRNTSPQRKPVEMLPKTSVARPASPVKQVSDPKDLALPSSHGSPLKRSPRLDTFVPKFDSAPLEFLDKPPPQTSRSGGGDASELRSRWDKQPLSPDKAPTASIARLRGSNIVKQRLEWSQEKEKESASPSVERSSPLRGVRDRWPPENTDESTPAASSPSPNLNFSVAEKGSGFARGLEASLKTGPPQRPQKASPDATSKQDGANVQSGATQLRPVSYSFAF
jgi:hypothetical protein